MAADPAPERDKRGRVTRTGAQITQARGAAAETERQSKQDRMQAGYDVYTSATGNRVGGGVGAADRQSRADYATWARTDAGKAAWKARKKPKPKPKPAPGVSAADAGDALADSQ